MFRSKSLPKSNEGLYYSIGLMSGTSMDGIDAAILATDGKNIIDFKGGISKLYEPRVSASIREAIQENNYYKIKLLEREITLLHAEAVKELLETFKLSKEQIDVIGFHGQTVLHSPKDHITCQIGDGQLLAYLTGIDVVCDFRSKDVAAGGTGAPLVPIFHKALAHTLDLPVGFLNIGGIANLTYVSSDKLIASDTGPGNCLIDDLMLRHYKEPFDASGEVAESGKCDFSLLERLSENNFFKLPYPKSADRSEFGIESLLKLEPDDAIATATEFTAKTIADYLKQLPGEIKSLYVSGGGAYNKSIMKHINKYTKLEPLPVDTLGVSADLVEAYAFAYLAVRSILGLPITFPETTSNHQAQTGGVFCHA